MSDPQLEITIQSYELRKHGMLNHIHTLEDSSSPMRAEEVKKHIAILDELLTAAQTAKTCLDEMFNR